MSNETLSNTTQNSSENFSLRALFGRMSNGVIYAGLVAAPAVLGVIAQVAGVDPVILAKIEMVAAGCAVCVTGMSAILAGVKNLSEKADHVTARAAALAAGATIAGGVVGAGLTGSVDAAIAPLGVAISTSFLFTAAATAAIAASSRDGASSEKDSPSPAQVSSGMSLGSFAAATLMIFGLHVSAGSPSKSEAAPAPSAVSSLDLLGRHLS